MKNVSNKTSELIIRIIVASIIIIAAGFILYFSENERFIRLVAAVCACFATYEFFNVTDTMEHEFWFVATMIAAFVLPFVNIPRFEIFLLVAFLLAVIVGICMMAYKERFHFGKPLSAVMLSLVVTLFFIAIPKIRFLDNGLYYLIFSLVVCITTDSAAYLIGRKWGKTKLIPKVSPNKTVEGAVAGIVISFLISILLGIVLQFATHTLILDWHKFIYYLLFTSVVGQFGDLTASVIKRIACVKDYGVLLPGHGGIVDRLDSLAFVFAFTYLFIVFGLGFIF